jgi:hypothetical protein
MPCVAATPRYPYIYYNHTGTTYNFRFDAGSSTVTSFNFQYGPTCDQLSSEVVAVPAGEIYSVANFPYAGQNFCMVTQAVNDCALSGWSRVTASGEVVTSTNANATTTTSTTTADDTVIPAKTDGMPVSGTLETTIALFLAGMVLIGIAWRIRSAARLPA